VAACLKIRKVISLLSGPTNRKLMSKLKPIYKIKNTEPLRRDTASNERFSFWNIKDKIKEFLTQRQNPMIAGKLLQNVLTQLTS